MSEKTMWVLKVEIDDLGRVGQYMKTAGEGAAGFNFTGDLASAQLFVSSAAAARALHQRNVWALRVFSTVPVIVTTPEPQPVAVREAV